MGAEDFVDGLLTSLKIISMIKEGQKVRVRNGLLDLEPESTGVKAAVRRWIHNDSRQSTIIYIRNTVNQSMELTNMVNGLDKVNKALEECLTGLRALTVTYGDDTGTIASLEVIQMRIRDHLRTNSNSNHDRFINN